MSLSEMSIGFDLLLKVNLLSARVDPEIDTLPRFCTRPDAHTHTHNQTTPTQQQRACQRVQWAQIDRLQRGASVERWAAVE